MSKNMPGNDLLYSQGYAEEPTKTDEAEPYGQASKASGGITRQWDEITFFEELSKQHADFVPVARAIFEWGREKCSSFWWGKGKQTGSFAPIFEHDGLQCQVEYPERAKEITLTLKCPMDN